MSIGVGHYPYFNFPLVNIVGTLTVEAFGASDVPWPRCPCVPVAGETWGWAVRACLGKPWNAHALKIRNQLHCIILLYYTILTYSLYIYTQFCVYVWQYIIHWIDMFAQIWVDGSPIWSLVTSGVMQRSSSLVTMVGDRRFLWVIMISRCITETKIKRLLRVIAIFPELA